MTGKETLSFGQGGKTEEVVNNQLLQKTVN